MESKINIRLCDFLRDGIAIIDRDHKVLFANKTLLELCGKSSTEVSGLKCFEVFCLCGAPCKSVCPHEEIFATGKSVFTLSRPTINGTERSFEISAHPITDENGRVIKMAEIFRDVTQKDRLAGEFANTVDFYHTVLDSLAEGVVVLDRDFRVVLVNKSYISAMGQEDAEGRFCYEVSHKSTVPCDERFCPARKVFLTGMKASEVHIHRDSLGRERHVLVTAHPIRGASGRASYVVETITDITEKKTAEDELRAKVKELEEFYNMAVGRELRMIELKQENERLKAELNALKGASEK